MQNKAMRRRRSTCKSVLHIIIWPEQNFYMYLFGTGEKAGHKKSSHIMAAVCDTISLLFLLKGIGKKY